VPVDSPRLGIEALPGVEVAPQHCLIVSQKVDLEVRQVVTARGHRAQRLCIPGSDRLAPHHRVIRVVYGHSVLAEGRHHRFRVTGIGGSSESELPADDLLPLEEAGLVLLTRHDDLH
jgi:uncharacterized protein (UPF0248 family)